MKSSAEIVGMIIVLIVAGVVVNNGNVTSLAMFVIATGLLCAAFGGWIWSTIGDITNPARRPGRAGRMVKWVARNIVVVVNYSDVVARGPFGISWVVEEGSDPVMAHQRAQQTVNEIADWLVQLDVDRKRYSVEHVIAQRETK